MRKVIFIGGVAAMLLVCFVHTHSRPPMTDVELRNVEALASGEDEETTINCVGVGEIECPGTGEKVKYVYKGTRRIK